MRRAPGAVPHATPHGPQVLVNQPVTLALPGARAGDLVMIVRQTAQGGCVEAASGGGGSVVEGRCGLELAGRSPSPSPPPLDEGRLAPVGACVVAS